MYVRFLFLCYNFLRKNTSTIITIQKEYPYLEYTHEGVPKSFRTGRLEQELQMVQLSATRCSCIAIL